MLIILNGTPAIRKHYIACSIADSYVNETPVSHVGLTFKMHLDPIEVYQDDVLVYRPNTTEDGSDNGVASLINGDLEGFTEEEGTEALAEAANLYTKGGVKIHVGHYFDNIFEDTGAGPSTVETTDEDYNTEWTAMMAELLPDGINVITGVFAPFYINKLTAEYTGDVKVINITRNPSIAYLFDDSYKEYSAADTAGVEVNLANVGGMLLSALVNNVLVGEMPGVSTIKFEDIITNGTITVDGTPIVVDEFVNFNGNITEYEQENLDTLVATDKDLAAFEAIFQDLSVVHANLPANVYTALNYEPIDYATITGAPS